MSQGDESGAYVNDGEVVYDTCEESVSCESHYDQLPEKEENEYSTVTSVELCQSKIVKQIRTDPATQNTQKISATKKKFFQNFNFNPKLCLIATTIVLCVLVGLLVGFFVSFLQAREEQELMYVELTKLKDKVNVLSDALDSMSTNQTYQENAFIEKKFSEYIADWERNKTSQRQWYLGRNNQLYQLFEDRVTYRAAKRRCILEGGRIASRGLLRRMSQSLEEVTDKLIAPAGEITWVGIDSIKNSSIWTYTNGQRARNINWLKRPMSASGGRCGAITVNSSIVQTPCAERHFYLCEKSSYPMY